MAKLPHLILACEGTPANALRGLRPGECRAFLCQRMDTLRGRFHDHPRAGLLVLKFLHQPFDERT